jgi:hypothetical protein
MGWRSGTKFIAYGHFHDLIEEFMAARMQIVADITRFEAAYKQSETNNDLPRGFNFKELENVTGQYSIYEIYVGPRNGFRAILMLPHHRIRGELFAYWVFLFKKQRLRDNPKLERAKKIACECWISLERG